MVLQHFSQTVGQLKGEQGHRWQQAVHCVADNFIFIYETNGLVYYEARRTLEARHA